jgi:hypothetical protein
MDGFVAMAEMLMDVAEAVGGDRCAVAVAHLLVEGQGPLAEGERRRMLAEMRVVPTDRIQRGGLTALVAAHLIQAQRLLVVRQGKAGPARAGVAAGKRAVEVRLLGRAAAVIEKAQGAPQQSPRPFVPAEPDQALIDREARTHGDCGRRAVARRPTPRWTVTRSPQRVPVR